MATTVYEKYYGQKKDDSKKQFVTINLLPAKCSACGQEECGGHSWEVQVTRTVRPKRRLKDISEREIRN